MNFVIASSAKYSPITQKTKRGLNMKTIATKAQFYRSFFERKVVPTDRNKDGFIWINKDHENSEVTELCHTAHGETLPDDFIYSVIVDALDIFGECETEEQAQERIYEIEPDVYTSDLTAWLNSSNNRVYYLTQALEELEIKDGFQALAAAQQLEKQEIATAVLNYIIANLEEE